MSNKVLLGAGVYGRRLTGKTVRSAPGRVTQAPGLHDPSPHVLPNQTGVPRTRQPNDQGLAPCSGVADNPAGDASAGIAGCECGRVGTAGRVPRGYVSEVVGTGVDDDRAAVSVKQVSDAEAV